MQRKTNETATTDRVIMSNKNKSFQKNKQQKLEQELAAQYRREQRDRRTKLLKTIGITILSVLLIISFCFPAFTMLW